MTCETKAYGNMNLTLINAAERTTSDTKGLASNMISPFLGSE
jgi:hypothetical protein